MKPTIIKETHRASHCNNPKALYTAYSFQKGKKKCFIRNCITETNDSFHTDARQRSEMAVVLQNLRSNNFEFIRFHCGRFNDPIEFLEWVKSEDKTIQIHGELFTDCKESGFTDFSGNLIQYSHSFMFRIYDETLLYKIKKKLETVKQHYEWKREESN